MVQTTGMNRKTGGTLHGTQHLEQSIRDILTTRIGTRVILRDYGSELPALIDRPINAELISAFYGSIAGALAKWEPRLRLYKVYIDVADVSDGKIALSLEAFYKPDGYMIRLDGIVLDFVLAGSGSALN